MPKPKNIIEYVEKCISEKTKLDPRIAWDIADTPSKWKTVYADYEKNQKAAFLAVSPYFFVKAYNNIPLIDLMLIRSFRADVHKGINAENYQKIQVDFWDHFADVNFAPYKEIQKILKEANSYELFTLIRKCQTILDLIITQSYFSKLLEGNFLIPEKLDYIDPFLLLRLVLQRTKLSREQKLYAIRLLQELTDITSIFYYKSVISSAPTAEIAEQCFSGQNAGEEWIKDKNGEYFSLSIPSDKLDIFMEKLETSFDKIDSVLLKTVIVNIDTAQSAALLSYNSESLNGTVSSRVRQYVKQELATKKDDAAKISPQLKRDLENSLLNPTLRQLFAFSSVELYTLMCIPGLNPLCHKVIANNMNTKSALINYAAQNGLLEKLCTVSPYFYIKQYCSESFSEKDEIEFLTQLILVETNATHQTDIKVEMCNDFFSLFNSQTLSLLFAKDKMLRERMLEKFACENFDKFEKYSPLIFFAVDNKKLLETESDPEKIIDISLKLIDYRQQGCNPIENVDKYLANMIDQHTELLATKATNNKKVRNIIFPLATLPQQKMLVETYPVFKALKSSTYYKALTFNFDMSQQKAIKSNASNFAIIGLSTELLDKIKANIEPQNIPEAQTVLQEFMDDEIAPGTNIAARLEAFTDLLKLEDPRDIAEIIVQLEAEKKSYEQSKTVDSLSSAH